MDLEKLRASDGTGPAALANITSDRSIAATTIEVDNVDNWPDEFIVVTGTLDANGYLTPASMTQMVAHLNAGNIEIDSFVPGYSDAGNTEGQVAIIKQTAHGQDSIVDLLQIAHDDDGKLKADAPVTGGLTMENLAPTGAIIDFAGKFAPTGWLLCFGQAISRATYASLFAAIVPSMGTFTVTVASPGVATLVDHGLVTGDALFLTTTGALPTGLAADTLYYAIRVDDDTLRFATSRANAIAGTAINTSGTQSGVHTMRACPYGLGDGSTTFNLPDLRGRVAAGADAMGGTAANRLALAKSEGSYGQIGAGGGDEDHTLVTAEMPSHSHAPGNVYNKTSGTAGSEGNILSLSAAWGNQNMAIANTGGGGAHNNVQPTLVTNKIIKT